MKRIKDLPNHIIQHIKTTLYIAKGNNAIYGYSKLNEQCYYYLKKLLNNNSNYVSVKQICKAIIHNYDLAQCKICKKELLITKRFNKYCSVKCKFNDSDYLEQVKNTLFQHYGVQHNLNIKCVKEKAIKNAASEQSKKKRKQTNLSRFGFQVCSKNEKVKQKMKQTNKEKYGNQFGVKNIQENKEKSRLTMHKISWDNFKKFQNFVKPNFTFQQYNGIGKQYEWKCCLCGNIFTQQLKITKHISQFYSCPRCYKCFPLFNVGKVSAGQKQLALFCKNFFDIQQNDRQLIKPYELDIVIDELKLAIEFNGCYWHSILFSNENKQLMKTQMCQSKGYRLIHIWQDQWNNNKKEIKQKLITIFENKETINISKPLDRCWYSILQFQNYQIIQPKIIIKNNYYIENCDI